MKEKMTNVNKNSVIDTDIGRFPLEHPRIPVVCEDMLAISNLTKKQSSMRHKLFPQKQATPWIVYTIWSSGISAQLTFYLQNAHTIQDCIQTRTLSLCTDCVTCFYSKSQRVWHSDITNALHCKTLRQQAEWKMLDLSSGSLLSGSLIINI